MADNITSIATGIGDATREMEALFNVINRVSKTFNVLNAEAKKIGRQDEIKPLLHQLEELQRMYIKLDGHTEVFNLDTSALTKATGEIEGFSRKVNGLFNMLSKGNLDLSILPNVGSGLRKEIDTLDALNTKIVSIVESASGISIKNNNLSGSLTDRLNENAKLLDEVNKLKSSLSGIAPRMDTSVIEAQLNTLVANINARASELNIQLVEEKQLDEVEAKLKDLNNKNMRVLNDEQLQQSIKYLEQSKVLMEGIALTGSEVGKQRATGLVNDITKLSNKLETIKNPRLNFDDERSKIKQLDAELRHLQTIDIKNFKPEEVNAYASAVANIRNQLLSIRATGSQQNNAKVVSLINQTNSLSRSLRNAGASSHSIGGGFKDATSQAKSLASEIRGIAMRLAAITGAKSIAETIVGRYADLEMAGVAFEVLTGSVERSSKLVKELRTLADMSPLELPNVNLAAKKLLAADVPLNTIITRLKQIGDLSMGDSNAFDGIARAIGDMEGKGKVMSEELRQLQNQGVAIRKELADTLGVTSLELDGMLRRGQVSMDAMYETLDRLTGEGGRFNGMLEKQALSLRGIFTTVKDTILGLGADAIEEPMKMVSLWLNDVIIKINEMKETGELELISEDIADLTEKFVYTLKDLFVSIYESKDTILSVLDMIVTLLGLAVKHGKLFIGLWLGNKLGRHLSVIVRGFSGVVASLRTAGGLSNALSNKFSTMAVQLNALKGSLSGVGTILSKIATNPIFLGGTIAIGATAGAWGSLSGSQQRDLKTTITIDDSQIIKTSIEAINDEEFATLLAKATGGNSKLDRDYNYGKIEGDITRAISVIDRLPELTNLNNKLEDLNNKASSVTDNEEKSKLDNEIRSLTSDKNHLLNELKQSQDALRPHVSDILSLDQSLLDEFVVLFSSELDTLGKIVGTDMAYEVHNLMSQGEFSRVIDILQGVIDSSYNERTSVLSPYDKNFVTDEAMKASAVLMSEAVTKSLQDAKNSLIDTKGLELEEELNKVKVAITGAEGTFEVLNSLTENVNKAVEEYIKNGVISPDTFDELNSQYSKPLIEAILKGEADKKEIREIANKVIADASSQIPGTISELEGLNGILDNVLRQLEELGLMDTEFGAQIIADVGDYKEQLENVLTRQKVADKYNSKASKDDSESEYKAYMNQLERAKKLGQLTEQQYLNRLETAKKLAKTEEEIAELEEKIYEHRKEMLLNRPSDIQYKVDMNIKAGNTSGELLDNENVYAEQLKEYRAYLNELKTTTILGEADRIEAIKEAELELKGIEENYRSARLARHESFYNDAIYAIDMRRTQGKTLEDVETNMKLEKERMEVTKKYLDTITKDTQLSASERLALEKDLKMQLKQLDESYLQSQIELFNRQLQIVSDYRNKLDSTLNADNSFSKSWLELNKELGKLDLAGEMSGLGRVLNRTLDSYKAQLKSIDKELKMIEGSTTLTYEERESKINDLVNKRKDIYTKINNTQLEAIKKQASVYTDIMTKAVEEHYSRELDYIERLKKARSEEKEDKNYEKELEEINKQIDMYKNAASISGKDKLEELLKERDKIESDREDVMFNRDMDKLTEELEDKKSKDIEAIEKVANSSNLIADINKDMLRTLNNIELSLKAGGVVDIDAIRNITNGISGGSNISNQSEYYDSHNSTTYNNNINVKSMTSNDIFKLTGKGWSSR